MTTTCRSGEKKKINNERRIVQTKTGGGRGRAWKNKNRMPPFGPNGYGQVHTSKRGITKAATTEREGKLRNNNKKRIVILLYGRRRRRRWRVYGFYILLPFTISPSPVGRRYPPPPPYNSVNTRSLSSHTHTHTDTLSLTPSLYSRLPASPRTPGADYPKSQPRTNFSLSHSLHILLLLSPTPPSPLCL